MTDIDIKKDEYYAGRRDDLIEFIPEDARRILEVGCGMGLTGRAIKAQRKAHIEVTGIEIEPGPAEKAKANIDRVIVGNVETLELPFEREYFDCILYGDVLEHLLNPWGLLAKHEKFLKQSGCVIASIPNVAHYRTIKMLRKKEWNYQGRGVLDKAHLRFFTKKSIKDMFEKAKLDIVKISYKTSASNVKKFLNKIFFGALLDDITEQYIVVARKSTG